MEKLDTIWIAAIGFCVAFISVMGKIVSTDMYPDKSITAKLFIAFSKAILGFILAFIIVKGTPMFFPEYTNLSIYAAWLACYFIVDVAPVLMEILKKRVGVK